MFFSPDLIVWKERKGSEKLLRKREDFAQVTYKLVWFMAYLQGLQTNFFSECHPYVFCLRPCEKTVGGKLSPLALLRSVIRSKSQTKTKTAGYSSGGSSCSRVVQENVVFIVC